MSEDKTSSEETQVTAPSTELFEVHGKKFDTSTPEGRGHLKGYLEAMSSELGRKNNEVGTLRKFTAAIKPDTKEEDLIRQAKQKITEGESDAAIDMLFGYSKAQINAIKEQQAVEAANNETWDAYLTARPDLAKVFDKKTIRRVSEVDLNIYEAADPFKVLDEFWLPKTGAKPASEPPKQKDTPPTTLSGGSARGAAPPATKTDSKESVDLLDIFDSVSYSKQIAKRRS